LSRLRVELADAQTGIERALEAMSFDPADLEQTEDRLFALRGLARKHNVLPEDLPVLAGTLRAQLLALELGAEGIRIKEIEVNEVKQEFGRLAGALSILRKAAGAKLDEAVSAELAPLKLDRAKFVTRLEVAEAGPDGIDRVTFTVATNPGAAPGPISKIASGGELSRFMLALKVCLRGTAPVTMIFDEIDRGVGGATADAVGRRVADLASGSQVLVVTHSPQVAARATHHLLVTKSTSASLTSTGVQTLTVAQRNAEIARMLSGDVITDAARSAATELLR